MLEVNKELWNATSYISFEPLKIILRWQFESRKSAISTNYGVNFNIYLCDQEEYITSPFGVQNSHRTKRTKTVSSLKACQILIIKFRQF